MAEGLQLAEPLDENNPVYPSNVREILVKAKSLWLKNTEVCDVLVNYAAYGLPVSREPPHKPPGGSIFLFDRKAVRFFRKDGHTWRKKSDGKTVRETHEKLKVGNVEMLNCYYAHSERDNGPQRRCYWLLESDDDIVMVHYLVVDKSRLGSGEQVAALQSDSGRLGTGLGLPSQTSGSMQGADGVLDSLNMVPPNDPDPELLLPAMSMDSFLAAFEDQDTATQRLKQGRGDELADSILPSWDELVPSLAHDDGFLMPGGRDWQASREGDLGALPSHVVHSGGSLRMIEPVDPGLQGGMPQDWGGQGTNVLGTRQMSHDARQSMRRGPSFGRGSGRLDFQDSLYTTKHEQLKMAAEAMQSAAAVMQGMAGSMAGFRSGGSRPVGPSNLTFPQPSQQDQFAFQDTQQPGSSNQSSAFAALRQQAVPDPAFSPIPEMRSLHGGVTESSMQPSPFRGQEHMQTETAAMPVPHPQSSDVSMHHHMHAPHKERGSKLGARSISMELPTTASAPTRSVTWRDAAANSPAADLGQDIGGSKARRGAYAASKALALEAELSSLDREVMRHLRQPSGALPTDVMTDQVRTFEEHLQKLESTSTQLLRNRSAPAPFSPEDLFADGHGVSDAQDNTSSSMLARNEDAMEDIGSAPPPFEILDYTPDWDFTSGGAKLIVACSFTDQTNLDVTNARLHVLFDEEQVLATVLRPGVIRVSVPPHDAGTVDLKLTFGDGKPRSCSFPFTYRVAPQTARGADSIANAQMTDRELQHRLISMLTGTSSQPTSEQDSGPCSSGSGQHQYTSGSGQVTSCSGADSAALEETTNLAPLTYDQCERLLVVLTERRVQQYVNEAVGREQARNQTLTQPAASCSSLNILHDSGHALLHILAGLGYDRAIELLIAAGAKLSVKDAWGYTPLHWAAAQGKESTIAMLVAREASAEALGFLSEGQPRLAPADVAAQRDFRGIAAFLAEQQLQQGVVKLKHANGDSPGEVGKAALTLQRKRSRHLPEPANAQPDPLLPTNAAGSPPLQSPRQEAQPRTSPQSGPPAATDTPGKENAPDLVDVIKRAKQNAETLEGAILRKAARRALRHEKRLRAQKREAEALERIQQRRLLWQQVQQWASADMRQRQNQDPLMMHYLTMGKRIGDIQHALETLIRSHAAASERSKPEAPSSMEVADYGSDSDVTMSRCESIHNQRKLQHMHNSRRLDAKSSLPKTSDTDIRSILKAGGSMEAISGLEQRSRSKSTISRALAHVEQLRVNEAARQQFQRLKEAVKSAPTLQEGTFKFARAL